MKLPDARKKWYSYDGKLRVPNVLQCHWPIVAGNIMFQLLSDNLKQFSGTYYGGWDDITNNT